MVDRFLRYFFYVYGNTPNDCDGKQIGMTLSDQVIGELRMMIAKSFSSVELL